MPIADAFGLALFTVIGAHKALLLGTSGVVAVLMGMITGVAGGMIRDVLAQRVPMVLREEIYATAAMAGDRLRGATCLASAAHLGDCRLVNGDARVANCGDSLAACVAGVCLGDATPKTSDDAAAPLSTPQKPKSGSG